MDCAPTLDLDMVDGPVEEEEEEAEEDRPEVWGRLFPLGKGFVAQGRRSARICFNTAPQKHFSLGCIEYLIVSACDTAQIL